MTHGSPDASRRDFIRGLAGRQSRSQPLPDHGVQAYAEVHGGSYAALSRKYAEMNLSNIAGARAALREYKAA